jgi:uncharacterized protein GlcG (DUF336 family)
MTMTLDLARRIVDSALAKAVELKLRPLGIAVLDVRGALVAFAGQDGISLMRPEVATAKAYGALALGMGSRAIFKRAQEQAFFIDAVNSLAQGSIIPVPGGVLIRDKAGVLVGALGISGDTSDNDEICAIAAITSVKLKADIG